MADEPAAAAAAADAGSGDEIDISDPRAMSPPVIEIKEEVEAFDTSHELSVQPDPPLEVTLRAAADQPQPPRAALAAAQPPGNDTGLFSILKVKNLESRITWGSKEIFKKLWRSHRFVLSFFLSFWLPNV